MASTISAGTTSGTAIAISGDTSGSLVLQTNGTTTAVTISTGQVVTLAQPLPVASGGSGVTTSTGTGANVLGTSPTLTTPTISSLSSAAATGLTLQSAGTTAITVDTSQNVGIGTTSPSTYGKLAVNGAIAPMGAAGTYSIDVTLGGAGTTVANGGTVNFSSASGMLIVNDYYNGTITIYLCGGGYTGVVSSVGAQVGAFAYNSGIGGYTWTSSYTTIYGFFFVRTRPTA